MTLGLPGRVARDSLSRTLTRAGHSAALACLGIAFIVAVITASISNDPNGWLGAGLILAMAVLLGFVARFPTVILTVGYLVVGAGIVFALTALVMSPEAGFRSTNNLLLALPRIALLLVGGAGTGSVIAIIWAALGYGLGEAAAFLGAAFAGGVWAPGFAAVTAIGLVVIVRTFDGVNRHSVRRRKTGVRRASGQAGELEIRRDQGLRATAQLYDTALSHLVAIAAAGSGPVDERLRAGIRQDLGRIVGRDWAIDHAMGDAGASAPERFLDGSVDPVATDTGSARLAWIRRRRGATDSPDDDVPTLPDSFRAAANAGLEVHVTGDLAVLASLGPRRAATLDAAVAQCLINVARHAGVDTAEVALGRDGGEVTVAVIDNGAGFDESEVPADRIGLRTSIRARIEQEQGTVRLWSTKGIGTTIVLTVPEGGE